MEPLMNDPEVEEVFIGPQSIDVPSDLGTLTKETIIYLQECVTNRTNITVAGGTGNDMTTTLSVLSSLVPNDERIVVVEEAAELKLRPQGSDIVTLRELFENILRKSPDRIIGEYRGKELFINNDKR